jgi:hypothetical protein
MRGEKRGIVASAPSAVGVRTIVGTPNVVPRISVVEVVESAAPDWLTISSAIDRRAAIIRILVDHEVYTIIDGESVVTVRRKKDVHGRSPVRGFPDSRMEAGWSTSSTEVLKTNSIIYIFWICHLFFRRKRRFVGGDEYICLKKRNDLSDDRSFRCMQQNGWMRSVLLRMKRSVAVNMKEGRNAK